MSSSVAIKVDQQQDNNGALNDRCLCGFNIEKTVYWLAVVSIALCLLYIIVGFVFLLADISYPPFSMWMLASYCLAIFTNMGIIFAQKQRNPDYYLPYLVYQGIGLISGGPLFLYMLYPIVIAPSEHPFLTAALYLALFELMQLPTAGIYWLVWRAWRLLQVKKAQSGDGSGLLCKLESQQSAVEDEKKNAPILLF